MRTRRFYDSIVVSLAVFVLAWVAVSSLGQTTRPTIFDATSYTGVSHPLPGTQRMVVFYEAFEVNRALVKGDMADPDLWRWCDSWIKGGGGIDKVAAITWNPEVTGPQLELSTDERAKVYDTITRLVLATKARYGKPTGVYLWPPVIWHQHTGASNEYAESVRQSRELYAAVDFFCPSAYMSAWWCADRRKGADMKMWKLWNETILDRLATEQLLLRNWTYKYDEGKKPVYPFLGPAYEYGVEPREWFGKPIGKTRLMEQIQWLRARGMGAVIWDGREISVKGWEFVAEAVAK